MAEEACEDSEEPGELRSARRHDDAKHDKGDVSRLETDASLPGLEVETLPPASQVPSVDALPDLDLSEVCRGLDAQAWLEARLLGLEPRDFSTNFRMYTTGELKPPPGFQDCWRKYDGKGSGLEGMGLTETDIDTLDVIFMLTNPFNEKECELLKHFLSEAEPFDNGPPVVWLFHSNELIASTNERDPKNAKGLEEHELLAIFKCGLDGVVVREQRGFALALELRALLKSICEHMKGVGALIADVRNRPYMKDLTKQYIEYILWGYIPGRYAPDLYHQCRFIPKEEPEPTFDDRIGEQFRNGAFGTWHVLGEPSREEDGCAEVLRVVNKSALPEINDVVSFTKTVNVVSLLSKPEWQHRNLMRCREIVATTRHFYFRFDPGGCQTLLARLELRGGRRPSRALPASSVRSIMVQVATAVAHLHTGPKVVHRDLKPESFLFHEAAEGPHVQLADFELAVRKGDGGACSSVCGTVPFAAPEVYTSGSYDGYAADVWSLGVIFIEIQCGTHLLHRLLQLPALSPDAYERVSARLRAHLGSPEKVRRLLQEYGHLGLADVLPDTEQVVLQALRVKAEERWSATTVGDFLTAATLRRRRRPGEELTVPES